MHPFKQQYNVGLDVGPEILQRKNPLKINGFCRDLVDLGATILQRLIDSAYKLADTLLTPSDLSNTLIACFIERSLKCE